MPAVRLRLRELLRVTQGKKAQPTAVILDGRTLRSTAESGHRAGYDGGKKKQGSKVPIAVDTLGHLLALVVTPANDQERGQVRQLALKVQETTGEHVEIVFVDQGYTGERAVHAAAEQGIQLEVVKLSEAKKGFVLLPRRWWLKGLLPGPPNSGGWSGITSAWPRHWRPLPTSC